MFLRRLKAQSTEIRVSNFICVPKANQSLQKFDNLMNIVTVVLLMLHIDVTMISHVMWLAFKIINLPLHTLHDNCMSPTHTYKSHNSFGLRDSWDWITYNTTYYKEDVQSRVHVMTLVECMRYIFKSRSLVSIHIELFLFHECVDRTRRMQLIIQEVLNGVTLDIVYWKLQIVIMEHPCLIC